MRYKLVLILIVISLLVGTASAATMTLRPNGAGTHSNYTPSPVVANYLNVDEASSDGDTTHNYLDLDWNTDYDFVGSYVYPKSDTYNFQDSAAYYGEITSITTYSAFKFYKNADDGSSAKFYAGNNYIFSGEELKYSIFAQTVPDVECYVITSLLPTTITYKYTTSPAVSDVPLTQNPFTSKKFTWSEINNMEIGFAAGCTVSGAASNVSIWLSQLYTVITYDPTIPSRPINLQQTTSGKILALQGAYFNVSWGQGSINTDSYNTSINGVWYNGTNLYANGTIPLNQVVTAHVYAYNTTNDELSEVATIDSDLVVNTAPVVYNVLVSPVSPVRSDDLVLSYDTSDSESDPITVTIRWYKDTVLQSAFNNLTTVPSPNTAVGEVWDARITPHDGYVSGSQVTDDVTILNVIPVTANLMTEHVTNNPQVTTNTSAPYFNWTYSDTESDTQTHWQVQVGTTPGSFDMWDSTALSGTDTSDIYAGSVLSGGTYYVQVRTNDSFSWSSWETGTFNLSWLLTPINIANTTQIGNFWINWTFQPDPSGALIDSYNVSITPGSWTNGSSNQYHNATSLNPNTAYTIDVYAYNNTLGMNTTALTDTMTVPNNVPVLIDVSSSYELYETSNFSLDANFTDLDAGSVTFTDNSSDWNIGAATGEVVWNDIDYNDVGIHNYKITINDGFGGTDYVDFTVTILGNQNTVLSMIDSTFNATLAGTNFSDNEIPISFSLTNNGSLDAIVTAKFTTSYGGVYGFVSGTETIPATNFKLGNETLDLLTGDGNPVTLTNGVPGEDTEVLYATQIKIPSDQDALEYRGTIELTFDTS